MTDAATNQQPRRIGRSIGAVAAGAVVAIVLSIGTDVLLHALKIYPPLGERTSSPLLALATAYRALYGVIASYVTAKLAPYAPMTHALVGGVLGLVASTVGAIATWNKDLGPHWYPIALIVLSMPQAWLGGKLWEIQTRKI